MCTDVVHAVVDGPTVDENSDRKANGAGDGEDHG